MQHAFAQARAAGFTSYPTLAYRRGDQVQLVAQGYATPFDGVARVAALREAGQ